VRTRCAVLRPKPFFLRFELEKADEKRRRPRGLVGLAQVAHPGLLSRPSGRTRVLAPISAQRKHIVVTVATMVDFDLSLGEDESPPLASVADLQFRTGSSTGVKSAHVAVCWCGQ
jgi:hypothetical protein